MIFITKISLILSRVFTTLFGASGGPEVALFKRFQKQWPYISQTEYSPAKNDLFVGDMEILRKEMVSFYSGAVGHQQLREDYLELFRLWMSMSMPRGGSNGMDIQIRAPGAMHHAHWMAKAIYALKIVLFQDQLTLTVREKRGITDFALFVALVYGHFWHEAPLASNVPWMLHVLQSYPNCLVADAAFTSFSRHLWFFSEQLVGLTFFDSRVKPEIKGLWSPTSSFQKVRQL